MAGFTVLCEWSRNRNFGMRVLERKDAYEKVSMRYDDVGRQMTILYLLTRALGV